MKKSYNHAYYMALTCAILGWFSLPLTSEANNSTGQTYEVVVTGDRAIEEAKFEPQKVTIITAKDIEEKQAKTVEDIIFNETGVSRTVDAMGRVGVSIRGAEARHTLILVDGQPVMGEFAKYLGAADEVSRIGTENVERIEIIQGAASGKYGSDAIGGVVNIITKKATDKPQLQFNIEGRKTSHAIKGMQTAPYSNFFLRADSGKVGKAKFSFYGSKRDVMPVVASKNRRTVAKIFERNDIEDFPKNSLRAHGVTSNIGLLGTYNINDNNKIDIRIDHFAEDLKRHSKKTNSDMEPMLIFKRKADRNTLNLTYTGSNKKSDWTIETNYTALKEDNISLKTDFASNAYEGKNELNSIDNIDHKQLSLKTNLNYALNDNHLLTFGAGFSHESGYGSRLKNAPNQFSKSIDPFDYDKSLYVQPPAISSSTSTESTAKKVGYTDAKITSSVHDYKYKVGNNGAISWDLDYETMGYDSNKPESPTNKKPAITFETYVNNMAAIDRLNPKFKGRAEFTNQLKEENLEKVTNAYLSTLRPSYLARQKKILKDKFTEVMQNQAWDSINNPIREYFTKNPKYNLTFNGKQFLDIYLERQNKVLFGNADIKKYFFTLQDTWTKGDNTIIVPIIRYDHSNLFGGNLSASIGATHNYKGNPNTRLKANIGTGYAEPGMGELYYNWEMYPGTPTGFGSARLGWYWVGNPNLKPEKSLNMDIGFEKDYNRTSIKASLFHNKIKDYLSIFFTGEVFDFYPWVNSSTSNGFWKFLFAPDMIYSFKNIGEAEITGGDLEIKQKMGKHWELKLGYTYLNARNKSDPTMPNKLLDKPTHKIDIGLNYRDEKRGWFGSIWGNYYIDMLDSNALANKGSYLETFGWGAPHPLIKTYFKHEEKQEYQKKTYGIWNFMLQKKFGKDNMAYFAIDNLFNHRDDERAIQEKVYRLGVNLKAIDVFDTEKTIDPLTGKPLNANLKPFINKYFDNTKDLGIKIFGSTRLRNSFSLGENKPGATLTYTSATDTSAKRNMLDNETGNIDTKVSLGLDMQINQNTNLTISGEASSFTQKDTDEQLKGKGINSAKLNKVDLTKFQNNWSYSVGRLKESFGATEYWFNNFYDGLRIAHTNDKSQISIGFGSFKKSTGISDSPYTHIEYTEYLRPPYLEEFLGLKRNQDGYFKAGWLPDSVEDGDIRNISMPTDNSNVAFAKQLYDIAKKYADDYFAKHNQSLPQKGYGKVILDSGYPTMDLVRVLKRFQEEILKSYGNNPRLFHSANLDDKGLHVLGKNIPIPYEKMLIKAETSKGLEYFLKYWPLSPSTKAIDPSNNNAEKPYYNLPNSNVIINSTDFTDPSSVGVTIYAKDSEGKYILDEYDNKITEKKAFEDGLDKIKQNVDINYLNIYLGDTTLFEGDTKEDLLKSWWKKNGDGFIKETEKLMRLSLKDPSLKIVSSPEELRQELVKALFEYPDNSNFLNIDGVNSLNLPSILVDYVNGAILALDDVDNKALIPREALAATGYGVKMIGNVVMRDEVPAINKAIFVQGKYKLRDNLGLTAWHFRSLGDKKLNIMHANKDGNDLFSFNKYANVFGIGAQYKLNDYSAISFDAGMNFTKLGRHLNGETIYEHPEGTSIFGLRGYKEGNTPKFWTVRFDIGATDTNIPGSWNAFADYKYFEHGSFFGGNGTESLPDRYLDGIKSFTFGAGYVPARNWLIEAFYTFGAEGIGKRDTLFGSESFKLGNLARAQITYKF